MCGGPAAACCSTSTTSSSPRPITAFRRATISRDFPLGHVGEIHLAGHAEQADDEGDLLLIDSHDGPVADAVWKLFDIVIGARGPIPTLVEWDSAIPDWPVLKAEAAAAQAILDRHAGRPGAGQCLCLTPDSGGGSCAGLALLDPERPTPAAVAGPNGKAAERRYNVYRNNVTVSLIDALAAVFPATMRITGVDFFRAMARFHVRATPPTSPLLFEYGRDFPDFIAGYEYAEAMPWLADVARIERAWLDAYHAADRAPLTPEALAAIGRSGWPTRSSKRTRRRVSCARNFPPSASSR